MFKLEASFFYSALWGVNMGCILYFLSTQYKQKQ